MTAKERAQKTADVLKSLYPDAKCSLEYNEPYQLLMATRLSAQCTDKRVNIVTKDLFSRFPTLSSIAAADIFEIEESIKSCGLHKTKANDLKQMAKELLSRFSGEVPSTIEELTSLPGVGRKTANLILGDVFSKPSYVVDTHCIRITNRIGFIKSDNPKQIEFKLRELLMPSESGAFCHRIVLFGRDICSARSPKCNECPANGFCKYYALKSKNE